MIRVNSCSCVIGWDSIERVVVAVLVGEDVFVCCSDLCECLFCFILFLFFDFSHMLHDKHTKLINRQSNTQTHKQACAVIGEAMTMSVCVFAFVFVFVFRRELEQVDMTVFKMLPLLLS